MTGAVGVAVTVSSFTLGDPPDTDQPTDRPL